MSFSNDVFSENARLKIHEIATIKQISVSHTLQNRELVNYYLFIYASYLLV